MTLKFAALQKPLPLALLSGVLLALSCAGPISFAPIAWIALVPLLRSCSLSGPKPAALAGFYSGLVYFLIMLYWLIIVMTTYGHMGWWYSISVLLLLVCYMSLYPALFCAANSRLSSVISPVWTAPVLWVALDFLRNFLFTGFPWHDLAYTQYRYPLLIQSADLVGHFGVTFLIVLANVVFFIVLGRFSGKTKKPFSRSLRLNLVAASCVLAAALLYSTVRYYSVEKKLGSSDSLSVAVIQGNIHQDQKWIPGKLRLTINTYLELSKKALAEHKISLLVWPETALPLYPLETDIFPYLINRLVGPQNIDLLTGAPHRSRSMTTDRTNYFNSAFLLSVRKNPEIPLDSNNVLGRYDKQHLVPFGEYIPLRDFLPLSGPLVETIGDFTPGKSSQPLLACQNARIGVLICYESIFPELARKQVDQGANMLVNITNDAWFGRSSAPWQHLSMAVLRSIESRRSMARAANTGISGFIDPLGRLKKLSPLFQSCYRIMEVPLLDGKTFYVEYGHYFAHLCLLLSGIFLFIGWRKKKS